MQISTIWQNEFGSRASQVNMVLGGQIGTPYWAQTGLAYIASNYGDPSQFFSEIAIAPYVGNDLGSLNTADLTADELFPALESFISTTLAQWIEQANAVAVQYGLSLTAYEAGQSLDTLVNQDLATEAQTDPRMGQVYQDLISTWNAEGGSEINMFSFIGPFWGLLNDNSQLGSVKWDYTLSELTPPGDASLDGQVGYSDLAILSDNYLQSGMYWQQGDFNHDGVVDFNDFSILLQNFGDTANPTQNFT